MLTLAHRSAIMASFFVAVTGSTVALAGSGGVDTPSGVGTLPLAVEGSPVITLYAPTATTPATAAVTGQLQTSGNVGIGISNPAIALDVVGQAAAQSDTALDGFVQLWGDNALIWKNGNGNGGLRFGNATDLVAGNWSEKMRIADSGNVGINTTTPGTTLEVNGATTIDRNWLYLAGAGDTNHAIGNLLNVNGNDAEQFRYWAFLDFLSAQTGTSAMRIMNNGNVGIGVTSPIVPLDVSGVAHFSGSTSPVVTSQGAYIGWNALTGGTGETDFINNPGGGGGGFAFMLMNAAATSVNTAMFIDGSGNVGINTTAPSVALDVNGGIRPGSSTNANVQTCGMGAANGEGSFRYNYTTHAMEYCNGTSWATTGTKWITLNCAAASGNINGDACTLHLSPIQLCQAAGYASYTGACQAISGAISTQGSLTVDGNAAASVWNIGCWYGAVSGQVTGVNLRILCTN